MSYRIKIPFEEANERLHKVNSSFDLIEYNGISKPCVIQCKHCGKTLKFASVQSAISSMSDECYECNKIKDMLSFYNELTSVTTIGEFIEIHNRYQQYYNKINFNDFGYYRVWTESKKYKYTFVKEYFINDEVYSIVCTIVSKHIKLEDELTMELEIEKLDVEIHKNTYLNINDWKHWLDELD